MTKPWSVYILQCSDRSLYTGISNDVSKRFETHQAGTSASAKYTKSRRPLMLVYQCEIGSRSEATKIEIKIKKLPKIKKEQLIQKNIHLKDLLAFEKNS